MKVIPIPQLVDNYAYLIIDERGDGKSIAAAVDVADASAVVATARAHRATLAAVLTTHHHHDHSNGNVDMLQALPDIDVYGGDDRVPGMTHKVSNGELISIGSIKIISFAVPCHTTGHVLFYAEQEGSHEGHLFTGDTLFIGGCGRFFEGDAKQMLFNLFEVIAKLPEDTLIWCGHEYTVANLIFARSIEPDNPFLLRSIETAMKKTRNGEPTVPSTVRDELRFNPFMRVNVKEVKMAVGKESDSDEETMAKLREAKNNFNNTPKI